MGSCNLSFVLFDLPVQGREKRFANFVKLQGHPTGYLTGNGDQLRSNQAEPGQAIKSAVAYFPSISCATSCQVALYSQAGPDRKATQGQEEISRNHVPTFFSRLCIKWKHKRKPITPSKNEAVAYLPFWSRSWSVKFSTGLK